MIGKNNFRNKKNLYDYLVFPLNRFSSITETTNTTDTSSNYYRRRRRRRHHQHHRRERVNMINS
jgi:hypothetical protein